jgi:hypothetical protein
MRWTERVVNGAASQAQEDVRGRDSLRVVGLREGSQGRTPPYLGNDTVEAGSMASGVFHVVTMTNRHRVRKVEDVDRLEGTAVCATRDLGAKGPWRPSPGLRRHHPAAVAESTMTQMGLDTPRDGEHDEPWALATREDRETRDPMRHEALRILSPLVN